ncbi:hypothetical protein CK203_032250 [Vitis vinifera]|uniref:Uncharacterized protein n=1 Tax=Vitis vinifera TaxID=29760 RepID=A0A438IPL8_VITVI|nr:hypothetical protein CK203_032250 [Vitis vinifera]
MAKFWVAIESKTFEVSIEEVKGKLKGFEECCREEKKGRLVKVWEEEGRKFRLERRVNGAGRYVLCSVVDVEAKRFCLVFPEGKGVIGGWAILAEKLRALGIVTKKEDKGVEATQINSKKKDATLDDEEERCIGKKKQGEKKSFLDVAKGPAGRVGEELWLQAGGRGLRRRKFGALPSWSEGDEDGRTFFLLDLKMEGKQRVLNRGTRRFKDKLLHLERWMEEAGCLQVGSQTKEVWVRVVGLPLHCWSEELFKSIGDCCGGLVEVDEDTKNLSQLQWARILVKNGGNFFPGTLNLVVKSFCYAVRLWWEVQPRVSAVEPMMNLRWSEGESQKKNGKRKSDGDKMGVSADGLAGIARRKEGWAQVKKTVWVGLIAASLGAKWPSPEIVKAWSVKS